MARKIFQEKKKTLLFLSIIILFALTLGSCNWFGEGILNVFDPKAQIRVDYRLDGVTAQGTAGIWFTIFSLNECEFIGESFLFEYFVDGVKVPELTRTIGSTFYVPPYPISSVEKPIRVPKEGTFPVYFQDVIDYMTLNPKVVELDATIRVMGTDGAGHSISKTITFDLPADLPGIDFEPPNAVITVSPGTTGTAPFVVQFDASQSTDNRGIASYSWNFGDGTTGTGIMPAPHTYTCGTYVVKLTVTDHWGNVGYDTVIINVGETGGPTVIIEVTPGTTGNAPFTVYFDASKTNVETQCGTGTATYSWDFGDGGTGTGVTTSHTYTSNGVYTVILTVTDSEGNKGYGSVIINVGVEGEVNAVINTIPDPPTGTAPFTIYLDASLSTTSVPGATIDSYTWNDGTGDKVTIIPITTYEFALKGTYLIQLTVRDTEGNEGYAAVSVKVTDE